MSNEPEFKQVFVELRSILKNHEESLAVLVDSPTSYYLNTAHIMKNKKPLFFAGVEIKKNYVSFHLMPVYVDALLLDNISADLTKRMQGKSCFNFKHQDETLFSELEELVAAGFQSYKGKNYLT